MSTLTTRKRNNSSSEETPDTVMIEQDQNISTSLKPRKRKQSEFESSRMVQIKGLIDNKTIIKTPHHTILEEKITLGNKFSE